MIFDAVIAGVIGLILFYVGNSWLKMREDIDELEKTSREQICAVLEQCGELRKDVKAQNLRCFNLNYCMEEMQKENARLKSELEQTQRAVLLSLKSIGATVQAAEYSLELGNMLRNRPVENEQDAEHRTRSLLQSAEALRSTLRVVSAQLKQF